MEIKHGRMAMAAFLGVVTTYSGMRFPGYLSVAQDIKFSDIPGGAIASWAVRASCLLEFCGTCAVRVLHLSGVSNVFAQALPSSAWLQIILFITFCEVYLLKQSPDKAPGDVVPEGFWWARYPDGYDIWLGDTSAKQVTSLPQVFQQFS